MAVKRGRGRVIFVFFRKHSRWPMLSARPSAAAVRPPRPPVAARAAPVDYGWDVARPPTPLATPLRGPRVVDLPPASIRRPLGASRANDPAKVNALMTSIAAVGQLDPIDVLECEGVLWGFSGCHRYEAVVRLGLPTVRCRVRRVTAAMLRMHLR